MTGKQRDRIEHGDKALETHAVCAGNADEGRRTQLVDLLTDLMHLADSEGVDFNDALQTAWAHHEEEVEEERYADLGRS